MTSESISAIVRDAEKKVSQKITTRAFRRLVRPVITVLKEYYGIVDTLCQANQMPGSVIWGSLKIIVDCTYRFDQLFETIKSQLGELQEHLNCINLYDDLYKDPSMQRLLCQSYVNVLRVWARVYKECGRNVMNSYLKAAGPFSTKKLDGIVLDLKRDADLIEQMGSIIEKQRGARERDFSSLERMKAELERQASSKHRTQQQKDRKDTANRAEPIDNDELLQYAAKYWDKHLEDARPTPPALLERTCKFVFSANFETLLQIQNLYVSDHFMVFTHTGVPECFKFLRRVFLIWLVRERTLIDGAQLWKDYRSFMHEWSYLIGCGCYESPKCLKKLFAGEIDRVMFGALGSDSFLSRLQSRYMSFKLSANEACGTQSSRQCHEGYSECG
ncbi:hypothetical protein GTA08_BOTSDO09103 [Botryosphaeria dothidea]|uniref:DUF7708 domain-containing protein n=1 Tax=Botryosphaeria dothidea TaxID=55169 RepID=A0A8H4MXP2_9PEZI|nr:hypothetical protein GTA08_BOTSDO09103 [Botryosphaeria dothidea]